MYIYIYIYIYMNIYTYIYIYIHTYICIYLYTCIHVYIYTNTLTHTFIHRYKHTKITKKQRFKPAFALLCRDGARFIFPTVSTLRETSNNSRLNNSRNRRLSTQTPRPKYAVLTVSWSFIERWRAILHICTNVCMLYKYIYIYIYAYVQMYTHIYI